MGLPNGVLFAALLAAVCAPGVQADSHGTLDTCEGAFAKFSALEGGTCRRERNADGNEERTPASCGDAECAELISSIDDDALAKMKTGFQVCA